MTRKRAPENGAVKVSAAPKPVSGPEKHHGHREEAEEKCRESSAHVSCLLDGMAGFSLIVASGARLNSLGASHSQ